METYTALRQFADSWVLLAMTLFFLGVVLRSLSAPKEEIAAAAATPFTETSPRALAEAERAVDAPEAAGETCCGDCAGKDACAAAKLDAELKDLVKGDAA